MTLIFSIVFIVFLALFALVRYLEAKSVFYPSHLMDLNPTSFRLDWHDIYIETADHVKINAWYLPHSQSTSVLLFNHGNAGNMSDRLVKLKYFHDLGFSIVIYDYRGFGKSEGKPTEQGVYHDAQAVYDWIKANTELNQKKIIVYGVSLGGAVAIDLANHRSIDGLIIDSSITSARKMADRLYPMLPKFFMAIKFDNLTKIKNVTVPKIFLHSQEDQVVPFKMGQELFDTALDPKQFIVFKGGHNDVQIVTDPYLTEQLKKYMRLYQWL